ncbi:MAG TPA: hypothetical protein VNF47_15215 [Streptosporangiaceae bacterium]|nr:hypothetical protein [Streptosporangiaceae bacterium]
MGDRSLRERLRRSMRRIAGWAGVDGNPLRRRVDRLESAVWIVLVLAFLVAGPMLTPVTGRLADTDGRREVTAERAWREVTAVLLHPAPQQFYGYSSAATFWERGRWRSPSGARLTGLIPVQSGTPAGALVKIWVNRAGQVTGRRPLTAGLVTLRVVLVEVLTIAGLAVALLAFAGMLRWLLNRRRMAYWAMEWSCFGPRWSSKRWPRS